MGRLICQRSYISKYRHTLVNYVPLLFVIVLFILPISCVGISEPAIQAPEGYATAGKPAPDIEWSRTYGNADSGIIIIFAQQTSDGGYIISGHKSDIPCFMIKTDVDGNVLWERAFGDDITGYFDQSQQTADGGYVWCGTHNQYLRILKTDEDGNTLWEKKIACDRETAVLQIQQTADGGYIIGADIFQIGRISPLPGIIKTDADGNKLWEQTFEIADECLMNSIQQTRDGGYILGGALSSTTGNIDTMWLLKTDMDGKQLWYKKYDGNIQNERICKSVQETMDGGYIVCGVRYIGGATNLMLTKTDKDGNELWTKVFDAIYPGAAKPAQQTVDGGYILCGYGAYVGLGDSWLIKTDADGNVLWNKKFGGSNNQLTLDSVQQVKDGGYILCGQAEVQPSPQKKVHVVRYNILLLKIAPSQQVEK